MTKLAVRFCAVLLVAAFAAPGFCGELFDSHKISRYRAYRSIHHLENLIAYLEANPYHYGGHKDAAIAAARVTIWNLSAAMGAPHYWVPEECCYTRRPIYVR